MRGRVLPLRLLVTVWFASGGLAACSRTDPVSSAPPPPGIRFTDVTAGAGISYRNTTGDPGKAKIVDGVGGGTTFLDSDGDGDPDLYVTNGWRAGGFPDGKAPRKALYRNDGGAFHDVTSEAGVETEDWSMGCVAGDYDGDGDPDLLVTNLGRVRLYRNDGRGRFTDVAPSLGLDAEGWGTGAAFGDADADGDLDLYVVGYIEWDPAFVPEDRSSCRYKDIMVAYGPRGFPGEADRYWRNEGDGSFVEAADSAGLADREKAYGFQVLFSDYDADGAPDLFVANDSVPNHLYRNRGDGRFEEIGFEAGVALSSEGRPQAGMGAAFGDFDGDLRLDLVVTNFSDDHTNVYRNEGNGFFTDVSYPCGVGAASYPRLKWAAIPGDFDADGSLDLFVADGHLYPQIDRYPLGTTYAQSNQLFRNRGDGTFEEIGEKAGLGEKRVWRGASAADIDGDGDLDLFATALDGPAALFRNDTVGAGNWIALRLVGVRSDRDAVGARVLLTAGGRTQVREVAAGVGFCGGVEARVHFGLGPATRADRVEIRWPSGTLQRLEDVPACREVRIVER